jgi:DNA-binding CsgD family transcriptional regulator
MLVEDRVRRIEWSAQGLAGPRWGVAISASMMEEVNGRIPEALHWAREAEDVAVSEALRLFATCRRAAVLRAAGERFAHGDLVARVRQAMQRLDVTRFQNDERRLLLALAIETASIGDVLGARALLKQYADLPTGSWMLSLTDDPREIGARLFAEAVVADAAGDQVLAHHRYREAFQIFNRIGYERRALLAAVRLGELTGQTYLLEYVDRTLRKLSSRSLLRERARRHNPSLTDPVVSNLSRTERAVLELFCDGKSTAEIAAARGRSKQTIRNTISRILSAFEISDRPALLRECLRRGIYTAG